MHAPVPYTETPEDFSAWVKAEYEKATLGRPTSHKLSAYLSDVHNIAAVTDPEVLCNTVPVIMRAITSKDAEPSANGVSPMRPQSPAATGKAKAGATGAQAKKDAPPPSLPYQLMLACPDRSAQREAFVYVSDAANNSYKAMRAAMLNTLLFTVSRSLIENPDTKSTINLQPVFELAYRTVFAVHIPPSPCLSMSVQQLVATATFIECLCTALDKAAPLMWRIGKEYTDAHMQQRARSHSIRKTLSEGMRHEITTVLACISACLKVFIGHFDEMLSFLAGKGGTTAIDIFPGKWSAAASSDKVKGKAEVPQSFDEERFKLAGTYRNILRKVMRMYIHLSDVLYNTLEPVIGLFSVHGVVIPYNLCDNVLSLHARYESLFDVILRTLAFLTQGFEYLKEHVACKDQFPPDYQAFCELLIGVPRKPANVEAVNMVSSSLYTVLTKDYLTLADAFHHVSKLAGMCCTVLLFCGKPALVNNASGEDNSSAAANPTLANTIRILERADLYSFTESLLVSALASLHRLPHVQKLPTLDDRAAIFSFCHLPIVLSAVGACTAAHFPDFVLLADRSAAQAGILANFATVFTNIYKQSLQCLPLISGRSVYRYDTKGSTLTYHPDVVFVVQSIVINAIVFTCSDGPEVSERGIDKQQSFFAAYGPGKALQTALPALQPLMDVVPLQFSCYLATESFLSLASKHMSDKTKIYPLTCTLFLELNSRLLKLPTNAPLLDDEQAISAERPSSSLSANKGGKQAVAEAPKATIASAIAALQTTFTGSFPLTIPLLFDCLYLGASIIFSVECDFTRPLEPYTSGSVQSIITVLDNIYALLASGRLHEGNCNESIKLLVHVSKAYVEYARYNLLTYTYINQKMIPGDKQFRELMRNIHTHANQAASTIISSYQDGTIDVCTYSRYSADIVAGFIALARKAIRLANIEISDQLFALYELFSSLSNTSLAHALKITDIASADRGLLAATRNIVEELASTAGQKLLLKQTESKSLPLYVDDIRAQAGDAPSIIGSGAVLPPSTVMQTTQWMQELVSVCIETLMLHTQYDKCSLIFQTNVPLVASSYELALYYFSLLTINGEYKKQLQTFVGSLNLSDRQMINFLFKCIKMIMYLPRLYGNDYVLLSESVLFLMEAASQRLESFPDLQAREALMVTFSAIKYSSIIQLGLYSEAEHDEPLLTLIEKKAKVACAKLKPKSPSTSRPSSRAESAPKGAQKQDKTAPPQPVQAEEVVKEVDEELVSLALSFIVRRPVIDTMTVRDMRAIEVYKQHILTFIPAKLVTETQLHATKLADYTEALLLDALRQLQERVSDPAPGIKFFCHTVATPIPMFGPLHADIIVLVLCNYMRTVVLQRHSLPLTYARELDCSYCPIVVVYAVLLTLTVTAYSSAITWASFATYLLTMQHVFAWLRDYGIEQLWSVLAPQLDNIVIGSNAFLSFDSFVRRTAQWGHGFTIVKDVQASILQYAINATLWGASSVGKYVVDETSIGSEDLNVTLFERAVHRLYVCRLAVEDEEGVSIQPVPKDVQAYISLCYAPRVLLEGIIAFFFANLAVAQDALAELDMFFDTRTCGIAMVYMADKLSKRLVKASKQPESPLHTYASRTLPCTSGDTKGCLYMPVPLMDCYTRFSTAVKMIARSDTTSWEQCLRTILTDTQQFIDEKGEFQDKHLKTVRSLEPCSPLREPGEPRRDRMTILSDYSMIGTNCHLADSLAIQRAVSLQCTVLECLYVCAAATLYGDISYWQSGAATNSLQEPSRTDDTISSNGIPADVLEAGIFVDNLGRHVLQAGALGINLSYLFSDEMRYFLLLSGSNRVRSPSSQHITNYYSVLVECIKFAEETLCSESTHPVEQARATRALYAVVATLLSAPQFSLSVLLADSSISRLHLSLFGMTGKRFELAVLVLLKLTSLNAVYGQRWHESSPLYCRTELVKAVVLERLAFVVETMPEHMQDIVFGSQLITNHVVARWLTETTATFTFDPETMSLLNYCNNPVSFCIHLPMLIYASNKALLESGMCYIDLEDLKVDEIPEYAKLDKPQQKLIEHELLTALNDASNFTLQLFRLFLTRGPFRQVQANVVPAVDAIVATVVPGAQPFGEAMQNFLTDTADKDKKAGGAVDKKGEVSPPAPYALHSLAPALCALATLANLYRHGLMEFLRVSAKSGLCLFDRINYKEFVASRCAASPSTGAEDDDEVETEKTQRVDLVVAYPEFSNNEFLVRYISAVLLDAMNALSPLNGRDSVVLDQIAFVTDLAATEGELSEDVRQWIEKLADGQEKAVEQATTEKASSAPPKKSQAAADTSATSSALETLFSNTEFRLLVLFYSLLRTVLFVSASYSHGSLVYEVLEHLVQNRITGSTAAPSLFDAGLFMMRSSVLEDIQLRMLAQLAHFQTYGAAGLKNMLLPMVWSSGPIINPTHLVGARSVCPIFISASAQAPLPGFCTLLDAHSAELLMAKGDYMGEVRGSRASSAQGTKKDSKGKPAGVQQQQPQTLAPVGPLRIKRDVPTVPPEKTEVFTQLYRIGIDVATAAIETKYLGLQQELFTMIETSLPDLSRKCSGILTDAAANGGVLLQITPLLRYGVLWCVQEGKTTIHPIGNIGHGSFKAGMAQMGLQYANWYIDAQEQMASHWSYVPAPLIANLQTSVTDLTSAVDGSREVSLTNSLHAFVKAVRRNASRLYCRFKSSRSRASSALAHSEAAKTSLSDDKESLQALSSVRPTRPMSSANSQRSDVSPRTMASAKLVTMEELMEFVPLAMQRLNNALSDIIAPLCTVLQEALGKDILKPTLDETEADIASSRRIVTFILSDCFSGALPYTTITNTIFADVKQTRLIHVRLREHTALADLEITVPDLSRGHSVVDAHKDIPFARANNMNMALEELLPHVRQVFTSCIVSTSRDEITRHLNESTLAFVCSFVSPKLLLDSPLLLARPDKLGNIEKIAILQSEFEFSSSRSKRSAHRSPSMQFMASDDGIRLSLLSSRSRIVVMNELPLPAATIASLTVLVLLDYFKQAIDAQKQKNKPPRQQDKKAVASTKKPAQNAPDLQIEVEKVNITERCTSLLQEQGELKTLNSIASYVS